MEFYGNEHQLPLVTISPTATIDSACEVEAPREFEFVEAPFLIFRLGASLFGVPSLAVREVHVLPALSPFQETAPFIVGVLNLRGSIVPVMDLSARFGHQAVPYRLDDSLIVLSWDGADVAIIVHEVRSVGRIASAQIEAPPAHGRQRDLPMPFIAGVTQIEGDIVMLLHLPHLLQPHLLQPHLLQPHLLQPHLLQPHLLGWPAHEEASLSHVETLPVPNLAPRFDLQAWTSAERAVLEERAARLRPAAEEGSQSAAERSPVAVVALGGEEFGVELSVVREFVSVSAVATVPCCPPHILGQINLRGDIVTLVDVRPALRTACTEPRYFESATRQGGPLPVVVVQHEGGPVGVVIDNVRDVLYLREDERLALSANVQGGGPNGQYFAGGALHEGRLLPLLDMTKLFAEGGFEVDESA